MNSQIEFINPTLCLIDGLREIGFLEHFLSFILTVLNNIYFEIGTKKFSIAKIINYFSSFIR